MTMQHQIHPDDERLSALAGGDPDATGDASLRGHLESCERCTSLVRELGELRVALAQLPDLPPSRPLQLIPPVPDRAERRGGWLRRLAAPAMAAGVALVAIGGIGMGAVTLGGMASGAGSAPELQVQDREGAPESAPSPPSLDTADGRALVSASPTDGSYRLGRGGSPTEGTSDEGTSEGTGEGTGQDFAGPSVDFNQPTPWFVLVVAGAVLLLLGMVLRTAVKPRAG